MNILKKYFVFLLVFIQIFSLCPLAEVLVCAEENALVTISAASYDTSKSSSISADTGDAQRIIVSSGGKAVYNINAEKSGYYKLLIYGKYIVKPTITVSGVGESQFYGIGISSATDRRHTIGRFYLNEGENSIALNVESGKINIKELLLKCVEIEVSEESETVIETHDYLKGNVTAADREDIQSGYTTKNTPVKVSGPVIVGGSEATKRSLTYSIDVKQGGLYKMQVYASTTSHGEFAVFSNGKQISKASFVPSTSLGVEKCESASFETFNLETGKQQINIKYSVSSSQLYVYYFVLERVGDLVSKGTVSKDGENTFEGENLFYSDSGITATEDAMKIEGGSTARADIEIEDSGFYAVEVRYMLDNDSVCSMWLGSGDEDYTSFAKTDGYYTCNIFAIKNLESGLLRLQFFAEKDIYIDRVSFYYIENQVAESFVASVNEAINNDDLDEAFRYLKSMSGVDYKRASELVLYKTPLYERLLKEDYKDIIYFSSAFSYAYKNESINPRVLLYNSTKRILKPESGELKVEVNTRFFNQYDMEVLAALYEVGEAKKLCMLSKNHFYGDPTMTFTFKNAKIDENKSYVVDFLYLQDLNKISPLDMFPKVYAEIFVSKTGNDITGDGTVDYPFKTIEKALEASQDYTIYQCGDVVINIDSGVYTLDETLSFNSQNSGKNGFSLKLSGNVDNPPIISGGVEIKDWKDEGGGIYSAHLSGMDYVRNLYINGYPAIRARSEERYKCSGLYNEDGSEWEKDGIKILKSDLGYKFTHPEDLEFVWTYEEGSVWEMRRTPAETMKENDDEYIFTIKRKILNHEGNKIQGGRLFYIENAYELLDTPGEFYYNKAEEKIYYMPHAEENMEDARAYVGSLSKMVEIKGESAGKKAENITFENLSFRYGAYDFASSLGYNGTQSDGIGSSFKDEEGNTGYHPQFEIKNAKGIEFKNCEISCMGSAGIHMSDSVTDSKIEGNIIRDISGTAITIGRPSHEDKQEGTSVCSDIEISNNIIRRTASEFFNNAAISIYYEKNIDIVHNDINMVPYTGITAGWGWEGSNPYNCGNINISYNKIQNVMQTLNDGGAIYTLGKLYGSVISNNYIRGSKGSWAGCVYQDAGSSYIDIFNNVILKTNCSMFVQYVRYNTGHLNYYNNYADNDYIKDPGESDTISLEKPIIVDENNLPNEALSIKNASGVKEEFYVNLEKDTFPEWRKLRINIPEYKNQTELEIGAKDYDVSLSSAGLLEEYDYLDNKIVTVKAGQHITFNVNAEKAGYHKLLLYGKNISQAKAKITVSGASGIAGVGVTYDSDKRHTIGRYDLKEGENKITLSVTSGGVVIKSIVVKNVMHNVKANGVTLIQMNDYYTSNITLGDQENTQWHYECEDAPTIVRGPLVALTNQVTATYKMNVEESGNYKMKIYHAGAPKILFTVSEGDSVLGEVASPTRSSDAFSCTETVIENITLLKGDKTLSVKMAPQATGNKFIYYYTLEKMEEETE